ncbi:MAG: GNAT family N-acetyltransferase [Flavobacteriales bacterium]|jgi:phosphinothricin acetyltransferase|nr:GNAT family N-acetyltransferase [Flavobacteriales bacterium]
MNNKVKIDLVKSGDFLEIAEIYNHYIQAGNATMDRSLKNRESIAKWVQDFSQRECLLVATEQEEVVGWGILKKYSDREGYRHAAEVSIYLKPKQTRKGLGSQIHENLIEKARLFDYYHLTAKIFADNQRSIQFFKSFGYRKVGIQHKIGMIDNQFLDMIILEKLIKE